MPVHAMYDYRGTPKDVQENFHGNQLVYVGWDRHLMFCSPVCLSLPPHTPFETLVRELLPAVYASHPDWKRIDWDAVQWCLDGEPFTPDTEAALTDQGIGHKSVLRLRTPGLDGIGGSAS